MEILLIQLIVMSVFGAIAAAIANSKGRSAVGWFFGGFFLSWIGVVIVAVLPNLTEQRRKEQATERENRRLREQLVQEQMKTEAFRQHASARLDAHDNHMGIDTRGASAALSGPDAAQALPHYEDSPALTADEWLNSVSEPAPAQSFENEWPPRENVEDPFPFQPIARSSSPPPPPSAPFAAQPAVTSERQWYFEDQGTTCGPFSDRQLVALVKSGQILDSTLVWTEQLGDWKPAGSVKPLQPHLRSA